MSCLMNAQFEAAPTAEAAQAAIADEFAFFGDWTERYQYLIDLGRKLPPFPDSLKNDAHKVTGCQSQVWLVPSGDATRLEFQAVSDSAIVSGLIALLLRVYSGRSAAEIVATEPRSSRPLVSASICRRPARTGSRRCCRRSSCTRVRRFNELTSLAVLIASDWMRRYWSRTSR